MFLARSKYVQNTYIKIHFATAKWGPSKTKKVQFIFFKLNFSFLSPAFKNVAPKIKPKIKIKKLISKPRLKMLEIWTFLWRNLHKFLDIFELTVETIKQKCLGKTYLKIWSPICEKNNLCFHKTTLRKTKKKKRKKTQWKRLQSLSDSGDKTSSFCRFPKPHFQNSFPYTFLFVFYSTLQNV